MPSPFQSRSILNFLPFMHPDRLPLTQGEVMPKDVVLTELAGGHCESHSLQQTPPDRCRCQCHLTRSGQCVKCPCCPVVGVAHCPHSVLCHPSPTCTWSDKKGCGTMPLQVINFIHTHPTLPASLCLLRTGTPKSQFPKANLKRISALLTLLS